MTGSSASGVASLGPLVRKHDPDRYFCALFAPASRREALFILYAFNHELARACEVTREPGLALIRLQWWREVVEGAVRAHGVAAPLRAAIEAGWLPAGILLAMIDAREAEAEGGFPTLVAWSEWLALGAGSLAVAAACALGAPEAALARMRALGTGYGMSGQLRNVAALAACGRCLLPEDVLADADLSADAVIAGVAPSAFRSTWTRLARAGLATLGPAQDCDRHWISAGLPAIFGRRDLLTPDRAVRPHGLPDRMAIVRACLQARC